MGTRRLARECALKILYQLDLSGMLPVEAESLFWKEFPASQEVRDFAKNLIDGVMGELEKIDLLLARHSAHWKLNRMAVVDKNILRLAIYELEHCTDIPAKVTLNEAIEIGKGYGSEESSAFINGVLDKIAKEMGKE